MCGEVRVVEEDELRRGSGLGGNASVMPASWCEVKCGEKPDTNLHSSVDQPQGAVVLVARNFRVEKTIGGARRETSATAKKKIGRDEGDGDVN